MEICNFRPLSVKFNSETVKDRGNSSIYYRKLSTQSIQQTKHITIGWTIEILYSFQICEISEFEPLLDPFSKLNSKVCFYGPLITHKNEQNTLQKTELKYPPPPSNSYMITLCMFLKRRCIKKILIKSKWTIIDIYPCIWTDTFWHIWTSCIFCVLLINKKKRKLCGSTERSYQVWFHMAQWFQRRRLKCKSLQTRMANWWQYVKWAFGSGELWKNKHCLITL